MLAYIATKATAKVNFFCQFIPLSRHFYGSPDKPWG